MKMSTLDQTSGSRKSHGGESAADVTVHNPEELRMPSENIANPFKFKDQSSWVFPKKENPMEKKPFLRKRSGLLRFYRNGEPDLESSQNEQEGERLSVDEILRQQCTPQPEILPEDDKELELFELLEQMTGSNSFCSDSSVITRFVNTDLKLSAVPDSVDPFRSDLPNLILPKNNHQPFHYDVTDGVANWTEKTTNKFYFKLSTDSSSQVDLLLRGEPDSGTTGGGDTPQNNCLEYKANITETVEYDDEDEDRLSLDDTLVSQSSIADSEICELVHSNESHMYGQNSTTRMLELEVELEKFRTRNEFLVKQWHDKEEEIKQSREQFEEMKNRELRFLEEEKKRLTKKKERMTKITADLQDSLRSQPIYEEEINLLKENIETLEAQLTTAHSRLRTTQNDARRIIDALKEHNRRLEEELEMSRQTSQKPETAPPSTLANNEKSNGIRNSKFPTARDQLKKPGVPSTGRPNKCLMPKAKPKDTDASRRSGIPRKSSTTDHPIAGVATKPSTPVVNTAYFPERSSGEVVPEKSSDSQNGCSNVKTKPKGVHFNTKAQEISVESISLQNEASIDVVDLTKESSELNASAIPTEMENTQLVLENYDKESETEGTEKVLENGDKEIKYKNGTVKITGADGMRTRFQYFNGDIRETNEDGTIKYFYSESCTWQTTYTDGIDVFEFSNGQVEKRKPDGTIDVTYTNGCFKTIYTNGKEECTYTDGSKITTEKNGDKTVSLANGQQELHTSAFHRRAYPNGTVRTVYKDGSQETSYPNGRYRMKDRQGNLIYDGIRSVDKN